MRHAGRGFSCACNSGIVGGKPIISLSIPDSIGLRGRWLGRRDREEKGRANHQRRVQEQLEPQVPPRLDLRDRGLVPFAESLGGYEAFSIGHHALRAQFTDVRCSPASGRSRAAPAVRDAAGRGHDPAE